LTVLVDVVLLPVLAALQMVAVSGGIPRGYIMKKSPCDDDNTYM
jgi:hypothetical protein